MPNDNRYSLARSLAKAPGAIDSKMKSRNERLGTGKTGGMFDIIYRKKKERERSMKEAYDAQ